MLKEKLDIPESSGVNRFFQSDEFARLVRSPDSLFVKNGDMYLTYANNAISKTAMATLRPEYAVDISKYDIHTAEGCSALQTAIK
jgi:hypothetical protein